MANTRECHAKAFDWHGFVIERDVPNIAAEPEAVARVARENTVEAYRQAFQQVLSLPLMVDPQELWEAEQRAMVTTDPHEGDRALSHQEFLIAANLTTLRRMFPKLTGTLDESIQQRLAVEIRKIRRRSPVAPYTMHQDMREFIQRARREHTAPQYIVTGQERARVLAQAKDCRVPLDLFGNNGKKAIYTAEDLNATKLSKQFWENLLAVLDIEPHLLFMFGNEVTIDAVCTKVGIPVVIFDRGGVKERFFRLTEAGVRIETRYGVPFRSVDDDIPARAPFIGFAKTTEELWFWLERMVSVKV